MFRTFMGWVVIVAILFFGFKILFNLASHIESTKFSELPPGLYIVISVYPEHPGEAILEKPEIVGGPRMVKGVPKSLLVKGTRINIEE